MIDGVRVKKLVVHPDDRGKLFEIWRVDDEGYCGFGQVYVTTAFPGVIKGWHYHQKQTDCFTVIKGEALFALYDAREGSTTFGERQTILCNDHNRVAILIPPGIYHGFKNIGADELWCANCPNQPYDAEHPDEYRVDPFDPAIGFNWTV